MAVQVVCCCTSTCRGTASISLCYLQTARQGAVTATLLQATSQAAAVHMSLCAGDKVVEKPFDTLLDAAWLQPLPGTTFEDRPPSPERVAAAAKSGSPAAAGAANSNGAAKPAGAYRYVSSCWCLACPAVVVNTSCSILRS